MFEHLDDPNPPELGEHFRDRVLACVAARRQRVRLTAGCLALAPLLAVGGATVFLRSQAGELDQVRVGGLTPPPVSAHLPEGSVQVARTDPGAATTPPAVPITTALNILVVGVDQRPTGNVDGVAGSRSDSIGVLRIDPDGRRVSVISLPRDLWIDADGRRGRINSFLETSPDELVDVVATTLGIEINHYIEIDFDGFSRLIDLAGGLTLPFDRALRDASTGFGVEPGCVTLDGELALAYARSRKLEVYDTATDTWATDPTSDLGRVARQQDLTMRLYRTVLSANYSAADQVRLLTDVLDDITVDDGLDVDALRSLFATMANIGPDGFVTFDLNGGLTEEMIDGNSVLVADPGEIASVVEQFLRPTDPPVRTDDPILDQAVVPSAPSC
jgi:polyisoprenyl-teichoic acid--peptidoglycan teichoic acid transferase